MYYINIYIYIYACMYVYIHLYTTAHNPLVYANFLNSTEEKIKCENDKSRAEEVINLQFSHPFSCFSRRHRLG